MPKLKPLPCSPSSSPLLLSEDRTQRYYWLSARHTTLKHARTPTCRSTFGPMSANTAAPVAVAQHCVGLLNPPALALLILTFTAFAPRKLRQPHDHPALAPFEPHPPRPRRRIFTVHARSARAWWWSTATCLISIFGGGGGYPGLAQTLHFHQGLSSTTPTTIAVGTLTWGTLTLTCGCTYLIGHHTPNDRARAPPLCSVC